MRAGGRCPSTRPDVPSPRDRTGPAPDPPAANPPTDGRPAVVRRSPTRRRAHRIAPGHRPPESRRRDHRSPPPATSIQVIPRSEAGPPRWRPRRCIPTGAGLFVEFLQGGRQCGDQRRPAVRRPPTRDLARRGGHGPRIAAGGAQDQCIELRWRSASSPDRSIVSSTAAASSAPPPSSRVAATIRSIASDCTTVLFETQRAHRIDGRARVDASVACRRRSWLSSTIAARRTGPRGAIDS